MKILLIEDDTSLCNLLQFQLEQEKHQVDLCHEGMDGLDLFLQDAYDLVLLGRMLPTMNGLLVLRKAREAGLDTPVILITALGELYDRVEGLDSGADDYIVKPFAYEELSARIRSLGRRSGKWEEDSILQAGDLQYDASLRILYGPEKQLQLSGKEGLLLEVLMRNNGQVIQRMVIFSRVWGVDAPVEESNLDTYIHFLRKRLQFTIFCTVITSGIVVLLTVICLFLAEDSLRKNDSASFLRQLNSVLLPLQEQDTVSHQWLNQIQKKGQIMLYIYDNNKPLYYQNYHDSQEETLKTEVIDRARDRYQMDIFRCENKQVIAHAEFVFSSSAGEDYYVSAGTIPKGKSYLSFLLLYPLEKQKAEVQRLRLLICLSDLAAMVLLFLFAWFFTGHILLPLENSRKKQIHFIASASHELRAPLSVIQSGLEVLKKTDSAEKRQHCLKYMEEESSRMKNLIQDLLLLAKADSRSQSFHMEMCQPEELLIAAYEKYEPIARKKQIRLSILLPEEWINDCCCDREKITQVLSILLDNAISYTPDGGKVALSLRQGKSVICFSVADTGQGIQEEEKGRIFDRFYRSDQAHSDKSHFGLGLCIAREIVQGHQGKIWVENVEGGGSCFLVELPEDPNNGILHYRDSMLR